jgi:hypothetical protein
MQTTAVDVDHVRVKVNIEEDGPCPRKTCSGTMHFERDGSCRCHISPPCNSCVEAVLTCNRCGWNVFDDDIDEEPAPLDNALKMAVLAMGVHHTDEVIRGRGESYTDPTTGFTHIRFRRDGQEYHLQLKLEKSA